MNSVKLEKTLKFKGNGSSLWGKSDDVYTIHQIVLNYLNTDDNEVYGEIQMFGPNADWWQYTDSSIEENVNCDEVLSHIRDLIFNEGVCVDDLNLELSWSEQGMQPDGGWSFDLYEKKEVR